MSNATLFVRFKDEDRASQLGFNFEFSYPVYQIDVDVDEDGNRDAAFLLADGDGQFKWISMKDMNRSKPPKTGGRGHGSHGNRRGGNYGNRSDGRDYDGPNPYGGSILGGRHGPDKSGNR